MSNGISVSSLDFDIDPHRSLLVKNSKFLNCRNGLNLGQYSNVAQARNKFIYNSSFIGNDYPIKEIWFASIDNCIIQIPSYGGIVLYDSDVSNTVISGKYPTSISSYKCVTVAYYGSAYFVNNTISNCFYAFYGEPKEQL